jgi:hypothetical protein
MVVGELAQGVELREQRGVLVLELGDAVRERLLLTEHRAEIGVRFLEREVELEIDAQLGEDDGRISPVLRRRRAMRERFDATQRLVQAPLSDRTRSVVPPLRRQAGCRDGQDSTSIPTNAASAPRENSAALVVPRAPPSWRNASLPRDAAGTKS